MAGTWSHNHSNKNQCCAETSWPGGGCDTIRRVCAHCSGLLIASKFLSGFKSVLFRAGWQAAPVRLCPVSQCSSPRPSSSFATLATLPPCRYTRNPLVGGAFSAQWGLPCQIHALSGPWACFQVIMTCARHGCVADVPFSGCDLCVPSITELELLRGSVVLSAHHVSGVDIANINFLGSLACLDTQNRCVLSEIACNAIAVSSTCQRP